MSTAKQIFNEAFPKLRAPVAGEAQPVAWVAADTLNSPHPTCISSLAYMSQLDKDRGREYVPLYAAPQPAQATALAQERGGCQKEHYDLMAAFERQHSGRKDREEKSLWARGVIYQDGHVNDLFLAFRRGYFYAKTDLTLDRDVAYGDGYNAGLSKGFRQGYEDALADVRLELDGAVDAAISKLEQGLEQS